MLDASIGAGLVSLQVHAHDSGANGKIYRYFSDNAGGDHFSGIVPKSQVPKAVLKELGF